MGYIERLTANPRRLRYLEGIDEYGYALAIGASHNKIVGLPELGVKVCLHQDDPLRVGRRRIEARDLHVAAEQAIENHGLSLWVAKECLAYQLAIQKQSGYFDQLNFGSYFVRSNRKSGLIALKPSLRDYLFANTIMNPKSGKREVDFSVAQCFFATMDWGVGYNADNRIFGPKGIRVVYKLSNEEPADETVANLVGSTLVEYRNGCKRFIYCRRKSSGTYAGKWSIPGGRYDRFDEVAGLAEVEEEMGNKFRNLMGYARPLCVADQRIADINEPKPARYISYVWRIPMWKYEQSHVGSNVVTEYQPVDGDGKGEWYLLGEDELNRAASNDELTPIMWCALLAAGYLSNRDCPNIVIKPSPLISNKYAV